MVVIIAAVLRRCWRRVTEPNLFDKGGMRTAGQAVQMDVTEGDRDLERQRNQRQHRTAVLMAMNPAHSPDNPPAALRANPRQYASVTESNAMQVANFSSAILRR